MNDNNVLLICFLILIFLGTSIFWIGWHNIDTAQNMKYLESKYNIQLVDYTVGGEYKEYTEIYNNGFRALLFGLVITIIGWSGFGFYLEK